MLALMLMAPPPQGQGADPTGQLISTLVMFGSVILIFYFMMIRPQQKRAKEHQKMLGALKKGDKVITASGIHGTVYEIEDNVVTITIASNCHVRFDKSVVTTIHNG